MTAPALRRVGLLVNPASGRGAATALGQTLQSRLRAAGHEVIDVSGPDADQARAAASAAVTSGAIDVLAVVGGDGTAHLGANVCAQTPVPLAIVAAGTGNDSARSFGLPRGDADAMAQVIGAGRVRVIDAGRARGTDWECWFLGVLGGGFDSLVSERAQRIRLVHGTARYLAAVAVELPRFRGIPFEISVDGERLDAEAMLVAVGNGPSYGGGMRVCPDAAHDDGVFDVLVLHKVSTVEFLRVFPRVFKGTHVDHPAVRIRRGRHVRLNAPSLPVQGDGERLGRLPAEFDCVPGALRLAVP